MEKYEFKDEARRILENLDVPFVIYQSISNRIVTLLVTNGFCDLIGMVRKEAVELLDVDMYRGTHPDDKAFVADASNKFAAGEQTYDCVYRSWSPRLGDYGIVHAVGRHVIMEDGTPLIVVYYMDESAHAQEGEPSDYANDIKNLFAQMISNKMPILNSYYDTLTGLTNMAYFFELATASREKIAESGEVFTVLSLNFNGMKDFNSKYGIEEGNNLLRTLAELLSTHYTNENCARFGEDHFYVYTTGDVEEKLNQIFLKLENSNDGKTLPLRVGVYRDEYGEFNIGEACDRAKIACDYDRNTYFSKIVYFNKNMLRQSAAKDYVLNYLNAAIDEKWIVPYYQPIVRSINGKITEEEALARWIDPKRGIFSPADFVPVLEESKLMYRVDLHMLECVLEDFSEKKKAGYDLVPVSINVSRHDFECCDMVSEIIKRIDDSGIPRSLIKLEITETVIGSDPVFLNEQIKKLHKAGIEVWMDNFGSGYSSLNVLQDFDFDAIKLDTQFMKSFDVNGKSYPIILGLIRMAKNMEIKVIAQGVETEAQEKLLTSIGCDMLQGFYYFQPVSVMKLIEFDKTSPISLSENPEEKEYYEKLCSINLNNLSIEGDSEIVDVIRKRIYGAPVAVLEWDGGAIKFLRGNEAYNHYLKKHNLLGADGYVIDEDRPLSIHHEKMVREELMENLVSDEWSSLGIKKDYILSDGFLKKVSEYESEGKSAYLIILPIY